jgi:hypothetical protein
MHRRIDANKIPAHIVLNFIGFGFSDDLDTLGELVEIVGSSGRP